MLGNFKTFTSFSTSDLKSAKEFYARKLELEVLSEFDGGMMFKTGGDTKFMVYIREMHTPAVFTVLNFEVTDIEKAIQNLKAKGVTMEMYPEMGTNDMGISEQEDTKMAWFKDNAGNILSLMQME